MRSKTAVLLCFSVSNTYTHKSKDKNWQFTAIHEQNRADIATTVSGVFSNVAITSSSGMAVPGPVVVTVVADKFEDWETRCAYLELS